jgi:hypothetical protein
MEKSNQETPNLNLPPVPNTVAVINHFRESLASGKHWYVALLESMGLWTEESENFQGQDFCYVISGEAFDWLLLASRLCDEVNGLIPEKEKLTLLFQNKPPLELPPEDFKKLIGDSKYHQFLNYFYGITVEEALLQTVREEVRKERSANGVRSRTGEEDEIFKRIYGETESVLFKMFRKEKHYSHLASNTITTLKEFTYWRFKYRISECEKAKVASDTYKALQWLKRNGVQSNN